MFSDIVGILGGFHNFILCLVIGLVLITAITLVGFTLFRLEHPFLGWYALFLNARKRTTWVIALSLLRVFYAAALIWMSKSLQLTHCLVYVLFALLLWCVVLRPGFILYDAVYSLGLFGVGYLLHLMHKEMAKIQVQNGISVLVVCFSVFLLAGAVGQLFVTINTVAQDGGLKTENDKKIKTFSYVMLPFLFLVLLVPYFMLTHVTSISLKQGGIQFLDGEKHLVEAGSELSLTEEGCMVSYGETSYMLKNTPVYDKADGSIIFTDYCSIIRPKLLMTNRINPMCKLEKGTEGFRVTDGERISTVDNFFFFDGLDTYYFPETTTLEWEGERIELSSFSKVEVLFNQTIEIFDYEKELYSVYEGVNGVCIATMQGNERIDLSTDILYRENGEEQMLFSQPTLLPDLE
ncbi:MAG: hypothetical protein IKB07_04500 [Lachnospiraceae bacterium]|nr:hypothetical protein [Lachnospiraceae bacterium]